MALGAAVTFCAWELLDEHLPENVRHCIGPINTILDNLGWSVVCWCVAHYVIRLRPGIARGVALVGASSGVLVWIARLLAHVGQVAIARYTGRPDDWPYPLFVYLGIDIGVVISGLLLAVGLVLLARRTLKAE